MAMAGREVWSELTYTFTKFNHIKSRNRMKTDYFAFLALISFLDCFLGGAAIFAVQSFYFNWYAGITTMVFSGLDYLFWDGIVTKSLYVLMFCYFTPFLWRCTLRGNCRVCWTNKKEVISYPCACIILCQKCARPFRHCYWCSSQCTWKTSTPEQTGLLYKVF